LDLGAKKIAFCEVARGAVVKRMTVNRLTELEAMLGADAPTARVVIEACREAWFVYDTLASWDNEVLLLDTTRSRQMGVGQHRRKNDRIDAEVLARALERGAIAKAHVLSPHRREMRREIGVRRALVETRAQYVTTIRGLMREQGIRLPSCSTEHFLQRLAQTTVPEHAVALVQPLLLALDIVNEQVNVATQRLESVCAREPCVQLLTTAPGVGLVVAASFVSVIDEAERFRRAHEVEAYLGLVPSENSSGGRQRLGSITKQGNSYVRTMLVQAAWNLVRKNDRSDPLLRWTDELVRRRGKKVAITALARRLAGVLWAMWRDGTAYDPQHLARASARGVRVNARSLDNHADRLERAAHPAAPTYPEEMLLD